MKDLDERLGNIELVEHPYSGIRESDNFQVKSKSSKTDSIFRWIDPPLEEILVRSS
jgi:hypothetical protein